MCYLEGLKGASNAAALKKPHTKGVHCKVREIKLKVIKIGIILSIALLLAACGPIKTTPQSTYTLGSLRKFKSPVRTRKRATMMVSNTIANPGYRNRTAAILYMLTSYQLKSYANNRWVSLPAALLTQIFVQALRRTGYFYAVVSPAAFCWYYELSC